MSLRIGIELIFKDVLDIWRLLKFSNLDINNYYFVSYDMFILPNGMMKPVVVPELIDNIFWDDMVSCKCVCERLLLHLYPKYVTDYTDISNYGDFVRSKCEMIILAYDAYYVEIYCKNQDWLNIISQEAQKVKDSEVYEKYSDNDSRTDMYV